MSVAHSTLTCLPGFSALIKLHAFSFVDCFHVENSKKKRKITTTAAANMNETFFFRFSLPMAVYRFIWMFSFACVETVKWPFLILRE